MGNTDHDGDGDGDGDDDGPKTTTDDGGWGTTMDGNGRLPCTTEDNNGRTTDDKGDGGYEVTVFGDMYMHIYIYYHLSTGMQRQSKSSKGGCKT